MVSPVSVPQGGKDLHGMSDLMLVFVQNAAGCTNCPSCCELAHQFLNALKEKMCECIDSVKCEFCRAIPAPLLPHLPV